MARYAPTLGELVALDAVCQPYASVASAAYGLGMTHSALRSRLQRLYRRLGVSSDAQALYAVGGPERLWSRIHALDSDGRYTGTWRVRQQVFAQRGWLAA